MMGPIATDMPTLMLALGLALLATILLRRSFRHFRRTHRRSEQAVERVPRPSGTPDEPLQDAPHELLRWQVDMHETARRLKAELDTKMRILQQLVRLAAEEREKLEKTIARAEQRGLPRGRDTLSEIERATTPAASPADDDAFRDPLDRLAPPSPASQGQLDDSQPHRRAVTRLAELGHSPASIADQVGLSVGDVEMLLSLRSAQ